MTPPTPNFNAHHSPVGAYLTFTCGHHGTRGGLAAQLGKPANQDLFIGYKDAAPHTPAPLRVLPFFNNADKIDPTEAFLAPKPNEDRQTFSPVTELTREYGWSTDRWKTGDSVLEFNIYSPFIDIPDPATAAPEEVRNALLPAISAELIIDNRAGAVSKTGFFSINFQEGGNRILELTGTTAFPEAERIAFAHRAHYGVAAELFDMTVKGSPPPVDAKESLPFAFLRWWPHEGLEDASNPVHLLGTTPGIAFEVPAGKRYTLRLALGCYLPEAVTTRLEGRYLYTRHYKSLEEVLNAALDRFCDLKQLAKSQDQRLANSGLSEDQQFIIANSTRSYYANTELLEVNGEPYWIVNEGEYCMMNTLDLSVDQVFWELERNPWVVKNLLDGFLEHYSYTDQVKLPDNFDRRTLHGNAGSGGLSFTHDQGTHNQFSPFGTSAYELKDLTGCFSYMTQEQLCNWILIAASYVAKTNDRQWLQTNYETLRQCLYSMTARRADEGGMMSFDSARCGIGHEITTYDSLDPSLGQARGNLYLAVKCWATYHGLRLLDDLEDEKFLIDHIAGNEIESLGRVIEGKIVDADAQSRVLPIIEAMVFALDWNSSKHGGKIFHDLHDFGIGEMPGLIDRMRTYIVTLLSDKECRNKFEDGGIRLSSTSDNSWLSKIAIVQHVARELFDLDENGEERRVATALKGGAGGWERADAAHVKWLTTGAGAYWCACDQIVNGEAKGSKYYPRLITTALWLREVEKQEH